MPQAARTLGQLKKANGLDRNRHKEYEHNRMANPKLALSKKLRNSARWQRFRTWFKRKHPVCCDPLGIHKLFGEVAVVEQVHHVTPIVERPDLLCVESNCRPLCNVCHGKIEGKVRSGKETKHLFDIEDKEDL